MNDDESKVLVWLLLEEDGNVMLARRKPGSGAFAGLWALPGDAMLTWESASETVTRIAQDLIDITVNSERFVDTLYAKDKGIEYAVNVFSVSYTGRPRFRESGPFEQAGWAPIAELPSPAVEGLSKLLEARSTTDEKRING